ISILKHLVEIFLKKFTIVKLSQFFKVMYQINKLNVFLFLSLAKVSSAFLLFLSLAAQTPLSG
ncbi:hypothetical protein BTI00_09340, partial [Lactobacillus delbrueckii subsp. bulgaricus]|nr:hypothetical protein [Lactobacillus delbrueckii subsp. bulgaricus]